MYETILVPLDGSKMGECALPHAEAMVRSGAAKKLLLVKAVEPVSPAVGGFGFTFRPEDLSALDARNQDDARKYLAGIADRPELRSNGTAVETMVLAGAPADVIAPFAAEVNADLILMSTHGRKGARRWVFGGLADKILRRSCIPVLMIRGPGCCAEA